MAQDAFVQVATDGSGKKVDMELTSTAADGSIYRQRATIVGDSADAILSIPVLLQRQISLLQAILATLNTVSNTNFSEEDFPPT